MGELAGPHDQASPRCSCAGLTCEPQREGSDRSTRARSSRRPRYQGMSSATVSTDRRATSALVAQQFSVAVDDSYTPGSPDLERIGNAVILHVSGVLAPDMRRRREHGAT